MDSIQKFQRISNACRLIIRLSPGSPTANFIKQLQLVPRKQRVLLKIIVFGQRLVHHPWKILLYLGALVLGNYKAIRLHKIRKVLMSALHLGEDHSVLMLFLNGIGCLLK